MTPEKRWAEIEGELPVALLYRPLSFFISVPLLNLGVPVVAVTLTSAVIACVMLIIAKSGNPHAYLGVAVCGLAFHILDCVDGNMARARGTASRFGGLLDGFIDMCFWCSLFVSVGFLVEEGGGGLFGSRAVPFSLLLGVVLLLNRQTRDNYALNFGRKTYFSTEIPTDVGIGKMLMIAVVGLENVDIFAITLGGVFGVLDRVLLGIGIYVGLIFIGALALTFLQAVEEDRADRGEA